MNRRIARPAVWISLLGAALACGGCSSLSLNPFARKKPDGYREQLTPAEWGELKRENAQRIEGEGIPNLNGKPKPAQAGLSQAVGFFEFVFWEFPKRVYENYFQGQTPGRYSRLMEDEQSADNRRTGILKLVSTYDFARVDPYTRRYWQIAQGDPDGLVRAAGIRALNRSRDKNGIPVFIKALDDANPLIRLEAAKALANMPEAKAGALLVKHLAPEFDIRGEGGRPERLQETRDVRLACADALRNYPEKDVATRLAGVLREKDFEVAWQARRSLILMSGHDFGYAEEQWKDYVSTNPNPFGA